MGPRGWISSCGCGRLVRKKRTGEVLGRRRLGRPGLRLDGKGREARCSWKAMDADLLVVYKKKKNICGVLMQLRAEPAS